VWHAVFSDELQRFLVNDIGSVERLDVLLFLYRHRPQWWGAQKLASQLEMLADTVQTHLERLSARNLLDVKLAESVLFCYGPGNESLARLVDAIALAHYTNRDEVVGVLTHRPPKGARLFAEAFHLQNRKRDG
jgi:hypothetical protein